MKTIVIPCRLNPSAHLAMLTLSMSHCCALVVVPGHVSGHDVALRRLEDAAREFQALRASIPTIVETPVFHRENGYQRRNTNAPFYDRFRKRGCYPA